MKKNTTKFAKISRKVKKYRILRRKTSETKETKGTVLLVEKMTMRTVLLVYTFGLGLI